MIWKSLLRLLPVALLALNLLGCSGGQSTKEKEVVAKDSLFTDSVFTLNEELIALTKTINQSPENPENYHNRALALMKVRQWKRALADLEIAFRFDTLNAAYFTTLHTLNVKMGAPVQAENAIEKALKINPKYALAHIKKGEWLFYKREYEPAFTALNQGLKLDPTIAEGYYWKGMIYLEQKNPVKSMSSFQTTLELDPSFYEAYLQMGLYYSAKNDTLASRYFQNAIRTDSTRDEGWYALGMWHQNRGSFDLARDAYLQLIKFQPSQPLALFNLGYLALGNNKLDEAIDWFSRSWEANNLYADALFNRGYCFLLKGDNNRAKLDFQKTLEIDPKHALAKARLSELKS